MSRFVIAQIIGILGIICYICSYQIKSNKALYVVQLCGSLMFCIQFFLLGAITGCYSLIILMARNALLSHYNDWKWVQWKGLVVIFSLLAVINTIYTWEGYISILPCIGLIAGNIGMWTNNARNIRIANGFIVGPVYLIYDAFVQSWAGVVNETFVLLSVLVSIKRYGWESLGEKDSEFTR